MSDALTQRCISSYGQLKNLKLVGDEVGIPWQTVYVRLRKAGVPVTGDKARYGSETDRLAARGERWFKASVPAAVDKNETEFQAKVDFTVHDQTVDVKVSREKRSKTGVSGWMWSVKKQELIADHFVCLALVEKDGVLSVWRCLLIPGELARHYTSIRISKKGDSLRGKWWDYVTPPTALADFFFEAAQGAGGANNPPGEG